MIQSPLTRSNGKLSSLFIMLLFFIVPSTVIARINNITQIKTFGSKAILVENDSLLYLFDAGYPGYQETILDNIKKHNPSNKRLALIILTHGHFDHYGSAKKLRDSTGALICINEKDSFALSHAETPIDSVNFSGFFGKHFLLPIGKLLFPPVKTTPDFVFPDRFSFVAYGLNAIALNTPGHTKGSSCFIIEDSIAIFGDLIVRGHHFKKQKYYANSWAEIDSSVQFMSSIPFKTGYIGHGKKTLDTTIIKQIAHKIK